MTRNLEAKTVGCPCCGAAPSTDCINITAKGPRGRFPNNFIHWERSEAWRDQAFIDQAAEFDRTFDLGGDND